MKISLLCSLSETKSFRQDFKMGRRSLKPVAPTGQESGYISSNSDSDGNGIAEPYLYKPEVEDIPSAESDDDERLRNSNW